MPKSKTNSADLKSALGQLEDTLEVYLVKKAPALPENVKEIIVKFAPWLTLIMLIIALPAILFAFGLGAIVAPFAMLGGVHAGISWGLGLVFSAITLVIEVIALPGLFKRSKASWNLLFYATLVTAVDNLISFNLGGLVIGSLISWYFLFQVKEYYK